MNLNMLVVVAIPLCMYTHAFLGIGQLKPFNYEKLFAFTILIQNSIWDTSKVYHLDIRTRKLNRTVQKFDLSN